MLEAVHRLVEVAGIEDVGEPDFLFAKTGGAVEAACGGEHDCRVSIGETFEQPLTEGIGVVYRKAGHCVKGAAGVWAVDAGDAVEAADEGIPSLHVFGLSSVEVVRREVGGSFTEDLGEGRGAQSCLCEFHGGVEDGLVAGDEGADAAAAGAVTFGDGIHHQHVHLRPVEVHGAGMGPVVAEVAVGFVGEKVEAAADSEFPEAFHLFAAVEIAGGVVGVTDHDPLCAGGDERFKFGDGREGESAFYIRSNGFHDYAGGDCKSVVVGVKGLGDDDFVTGVKAAHEPKQDSFGATGGDDDLVVVDVDPYSFIVCGQFAAVAFVPCAMAVFEDFKIEVADSVEGHRGRLDIGLADVEMINLDPLLFGGFRVGYEFPDRRCRHLLSAVTDR